MIPDSLESLGGFVVWTAWKNGKHRSDGNGYGFKVSAEDRDSHFDHRWSTVFIELPARSSVVTAEVGVSKNSFWDADCRELISRTIGQWFFTEGYAPWTRGAPPKFEVRKSGTRRFRVVAKVAA